MEGFLSKKFILVALLVIITCDRSYDDPNWIDTHTREHYQVPEDIMKNCEMDEMIAYGLTGDAESFGEANEVCPAIGDNCCGKGD